MLRIISALYMVSEVVRTRNIDIYRTRWICAFNGTISIIIKRARTGKFNSRFRLGNMQKTNLNLNEFN